MTPRISGQDPIIWSHLRLSIYKWVSIQYLGTVAKGPLSLSQKPYIKPFGLEHLSRESVTFWIGLIPLGRENKKCNKEQVHKWCMYFWTELRNKWLVILANQKESKQRPVKRMSHSFFVVLARPIGLSASRSRSHQHHSPCYLVLFLSSPPSTIGRKLLNFSHTWYPLL